MRKSKYCSWILLERRLANQNYDSLTQSIKRKDEKIKTELTPLTKVVVETKIDLNDVSLTETENIENINNININIDNRSKIRSSYGDEDSDTSISSKPIYPSYKDACMNNNITYGRHDNATRPPPVTSE